MEVLKLYRGKAQKVFRSIIDFFIYILIIIASWFINCHTPAKLHYNLEVLHVLDRFVYLNKYGKYTLGFPHCKEPPIPNYTHASQWYIL